MNIHFNTFNKYNTTVSNYNKKTEKTEITPASFNSNKVDVIKISSDASDYSQIAAAQNSISANVNACGSSDKLENIKNMISNGSYNVSSKDIADKIIERFA